MYCYVIELAWPARVNTHNSREGIAMRKRNEVKKKKQIMAVSCWHLDSPVLRFVLKKKRGKKKVRTREPTKGCLLHMPVSERAQQRGELLHPVGLPSGERRRILPVSLVSFISPVQTTRL